MLHTCGNELYFAYRPALMGPLMNRIWDGGDRSPDITREIHCFLGFFLFDPLSSWNTILVGEVFFINLSNNYIMYRYLRSKIIFFVFFPQTRSITKLHLPASISNTSKYPNIQKSFMRTCHLCRPKSQSNHSRFHTGRPRSDRPTSRYCLGGVWW